MNEMVTIPKAEYERLLAAAEDLADIAAYDRAKAALAAGHDQLIPAEFANRLIAGESPVRVYREFRGLTQLALSEASGVNRVQIANIESGSKQGSVDTLKKLAGALGVSLDDLA
ncbi:MAG: transcriptional regulator, family [Devosia sp.]|uniref:helix-turn-helix transcriptional regulator n=1 Tax=Devosia sp. TaxID=1871048 RepID=UPI00261A4422|nr:helix-turn-helix transcriptional regulator [Devosia sp.]MDB5540123.1 transcriptional regulator, family [Devosia sp.]